MRTIDITNLADFLGHQPLPCEICHHRGAAVLMIARDEELDDAANETLRTEHSELRIQKAHVCSTCLEIAEQSNFQIALESVSLQDFC